MRIAFDMETRDPDDALTLCMLADHPRVELTAVTVNPGAPPQIGLVRELLRRCGRAEVPVGARVTSSDRDVVSPFHREWLGDLPAGQADGVAHDLLARAIAGGAVLLTGAPLHNLRLLLNHHPELAIDRWVAQGGFAGDNLVGPAQRLAKFDGLVSCESFNFGGDRKATRLALASPRIARRELVAKNLTHGIAWDGQVQERMSSIAAPRAGLALMVDAMGHYLRAHPAGKLLHDPLAAAAAIDPSLFVWSEIEVTYGEGKWGAIAASGTDTFISIGVDRAGFFDLVAG